MAALVGFESSGKSALFRGLTGRDTGAEANFRGSTVTARQGALADDLDLVDLPGIRLKDDSVATQAAIGKVTAADVVILVVRATHAAVELPLLLDSVDVSGKNALLVLTFADKMPARLPELVRYYGDWLSVPVRTVDARKLREESREELTRSLAGAKPIRPKARTLLAPFAPAATPQTTWFERPVWGRPLALAATFLCFAVPVFLAYLLSQWLQPLADRFAIDPLRSLFAGQNDIVRTIMVGDYGLVTLGWYSFLWAFPVVLLLGISLALVEESGLKDRITDSLDAWLRPIGLSGRDLIPVLSGFGCNVVAVFQSRACSACTRKSCVSLIAFGAACSYQIGASLSVFGSAGHPWLFLPYLLVLFFAGALHTRLWNRKAPPPAPPVYETRTFLQLPSPRALIWRVRVVVKQFLTQAMPIFLVICLAATVLELSGALGWLTGAMGPALRIFHLPEEAAGGIAFSILRKDGLLVLNRDDGAFLQTLQAGQVFVFVYLASTLTACLVTLWTVRKELGWSFAASMAGKQLLTSLATTSVVALLAGR